MGSSFHPSPRPLINPDHPVICFAWFVSFVWSDQIDQMNQINNTRLARLCPPITQNSEPRTQNFFTRPADPVIKCDSATNRFQFT